MGQKQATELEFVWRENELTHVPTGATFTVRTGSTEIAMTLVGLLGARLEDGHDYDVESVMDLAWKLVEQRQR